MSSLLLLANEEKFISDFRIIFPCVAGTKINLTYLHNYTFVWNGNEIIINFNGYYKFYMCQEIFFQLCHTLVLHEQGFFLWLSQAILVTKKKTLTHIPIEHPNWVIFLIPPLYVKLSLVSPKEILSLVSPHSSVSVPFIWMYGWSCWQEK